MSGHENRSTALGHEEPPEHGAIKQRTMSRLSPNTSASDLRGGRRAPPPPIIAAYRVLGAPLENRPKDLASKLVIPEPWRIPSPLRLRCQHPPVGCRAKCNCIGGR
ncbi:unnamed protein product, partial [Iphiclides podalirius]